MVNRRHVLTVAAGLFVVACDQGTQPVAPDIDARVSPAVVGDRGPGAVFLTSNAAGGNSILVFARASDGALTPAGEVPTGGLGTGAGLGNQLAMAFTGDHRRLYVVNAGSDDISAFEVDGTALHAIGAPISSGGDQPISLTTHGDLLYVLNGGSGGSVSGFRIAPDGVLTPIQGSTRPLSGADTGPAQIEFTPSGRVLVVTQKSTNTLMTFVVDGAGRAGEPRTWAAAGQTPFGFSFNSRGDLVVSEAGGTGDGLSTASSYRVADDGAVSLVSGPVATSQAAACWIAIDASGRFAYTTNTGSGTVSQLDIGVGGLLALHAGVAGVTGAGSRPQDADFTPGGRFLYVRNAAGSVSGFRVGSDGALTPIGTFGPIPDFASGIVAR